MALTLPVLNTTALTESGEDPVVTKYYFHAGKRVALDREGVVQWLVGDHLGSTSLVLDDQGGKVAESRHYPYGEERWRWPEEGTFPTEYRFTGQRSDSGLGLIHMGARHYDPALGRWTSADTLVPDPGSPQSFNRYSWVLGNPLRYRDPTGHDGWDAINDFLEGIAYEFAANNCDAVFLPATSPARQGAEALAVDKSDNVNFQLGRVVGGIANVVQGIIEIEAGTIIAEGGITGGLATAPTIAGAATGVGVAAVGIAVVAHGGAVAVTGVIGVGEAGANLLNAMVGDGSGGSTLLTTSEKRARKELGLTKSQFKEAIHDIKDQVEGNPDMLFDLETGDVFDQRSGEWVGNLLDYAD